MGGRRRSLALALAVLSAHASACGEAPSRRQAGPRNAVLIVLDTVRADHLSGAGYERSTTPALDALAANGVVFEQAISYSPWTLPSLVAFPSKEGTIAPLYWTWQTLFCLKFRHFVRITVMPGF